MLECILAKPCNFFIYTGKITFVKKENACVQENRNSRFRLLKLKQHPLNLYKCVGGYELFIILR